MGGPTLRGTPCFLGLAMTRERESGRADRRSIRKPLFLSVTSNDNLQQDASGWSRL